MSEYPKNEHRVGDKLVVIIPRWLRELQHEPSFYEELLKWVNTFEEYPKMEFLCIDFYGYCWFRVNKF